MIKYMVIAFTLFLSIGTSMDVEAATHVSDYANTIFSVHMVDDDNVLFNDVDDPYTIDEITRLITAIDDVDGNISHLLYVVLDNYSDHMTVFGDYVIIFGVVDSGNQETQIAITVRNVDVSAPRFELQAESTLNIPQYSLLAANLPQIKAIDDHDGDITNKILITGLSGIDTNVLGEHELTYTVTDDYGNTTTETFTAKVVDSVAPVLTGVDTIVKRQDYILDGQFFLAYFTAEDDHDGLISNRIEVLEDEYLGNANKPGSYRVVVSVSDLQGNRAQHTLYISVVKDMIPHLILDKYYWVTPNDHKLTEDDFIDTLQFIGDLPNYTYVFTSTYDNYTPLWETVGTYQKNFDLLSNTGNEYQRDIVVEVALNNLNIIEEEPGYFEANSTTIITGVVIVVVIGLFFFGLAKSK